MSQIRTHTDAFYQAFVDNFNGVAYECDRKFQVTYLSGAIRELTGFSRGDLIERRVGLGDLVHSDDLETLLGERRQVQTIPYYTYDLEYRLLTKNGPEKWVHENCRNLGADASSPSNICGVIYDVDVYKRASHERFQLELNLQQAQKLDSLEMMAAGVAHDFNNLLTAILGNTDLALETLPQGALERECIENADAAARRAAQLSKLMLVYVGQGRSKTELLNLLGPVNEVAIALGGKLPAEVKLALDLEGEPVWVKGDRAQLKQVIENLLSNAVDALEDSFGTIELRAEVKTLNASWFKGCSADYTLGSGEYVCLSVIDSGTGIKSEIRSRIFDPFFTTKFTGRGLGLAAVLGIIRGHLGAIKCESQPGVGATFTVALPRASHEQKVFGGNAKLTAARQTLTGAKVLLIDDEDVVLEVCSRMLNQAGVQAVMASSGKEAIEKYRRLSSSLDFVILDFSMPDMDGGEVFRVFKEIDKSVPIIISSGFSESQIGRSFASEGATAFLQKPYHYSELVQKMREILD